ncbi:hypothetical protein EG349_10555 [Chryseobacterium shandongense]|jgi:hypothetical protein|uniref:DUF4843 domain-containing protein n=1 Tax=Chryseobacterium shandongense TaxID=1493872 RepID=A0A3G6Q5V2_9FLAO|nr:hypothetical protein [Chryseobacterium shandongense]AZA59050.1 hypothetical protein EG350_18480 [Chryseobacterium shandongense]AZA87197.1 hypothetical protein EG349_10555 [Chryseobacterium shandongense]AZA95696.1 hypothetical protein EG353_09010 [Chryseobacterium shandongense]
MKKFLNIFTVAASLLTLVYCSEAEQPFTEGDSYLHFAKEQSGNAYVELNSGNATFKVPYGVTKAVEGDHNVELVLDQSKSTAVLGTDFTVSSATLPSGSVFGDINLNIKESAAAAGKKAVFKVKSATLPSANFKNEYTVNFNLRCPISSFVGNFTNTESWWNNPGGNFQIVQGTVANQLLVKDFWDVGFDLKLNYNPDTYVITVPDQSTGYFVAQYNGYIYAKPTTAGQVSSFNPCTRQVTLYIQYYIPNVGSYGNQVEKFVGF